MKIKKKLYIGWDVKSYRSTGGDYSVKDINPTWDPDFKLLVTQDVEFEVPEVDARGELVESLQRKKAEIISKATAEAGVLEEQIQQLLALPAGEA